ncbi:MAG: DUF4214 domain-containing protein, partial [Gemmataceae bacterium]|nr:DUF4214 domain-containing protein [Gemmataceae bacterium]
MYEVDLNTGAATAIAPIAGGAVVQSLAARTINELNFTANERIVNRLYQDILGRAADRGGLAGFASQLNSGASVASVAAAIAGSPEGRAIRVNELFRRYLGRNADQGSLDANVQFLNSGGTDRQIAASILGSAEYFARNGGTNTTFVQALFRDALGRPVDPATQASLEARLAAGASRQ